MFSEIPYFGRVLILTSLMFVAAVYDYYRNRGGATRWREYGLVLVGGLVGAVFAAVNDIVTSSISPEYFTLGKGLAGGDGLQTRAALLGMQAGSSAGLIAAGILLYVATRKYKGTGLVYKVFLRGVCKVFAGAVLLGVVMPMIFSSFDPARFAVELEGLVDANQIRRFIIVWWIHSGLYVGAFVGLIWAIAGSVGQRSKKGS